MDAISAEGLSKTYKSAVLRRREVRALSDFSLTVQPGQIFGLLGPNGAGKTTFIKILLSLTHPSAGRAEILGRPITDVAVRHHVGYLPENHRFPQHLTAEQVLTLAGRLTGVPGPIIRMRIDNLLTLVGMSQWRKVKIKKYSKGMTQRLGLAQALVNDPSLIFLDEPTDGVDPVGRKEIRDILRDLRDRGKTIFLNSHLLSEVEMVSDAVAILDKGNLLKIGTVDELTATSDQYQIGFEGPLPDTVHTELKAFVVPARVAGSLLTVDAKTVGELNRIIDLLRNNGVSITSLVRQKNTLEESFISLIKRETTG